MKATDSSRVEPAQKPLRAFILEDNPRDAKLMVAMLERDGYAVKYDVTDSQDLFRERLEQGEYDVVLADFNLRSWNAFDALEILRQSGKDVPLIVVTGSLGDEGAVDCVKRGAADFVLKDRPARLPLAIKQALEDKRLRDEQKRAEDQLRDSEAKFRLLFAANPLPMWVYDIETLRFLEVNDAAVAYYGYTRDEFFNMRTTDIRPAGYVDFLSESFVQDKPVMDSSGPWRHRLKDGHIIRVQITSHTIEWMGRRAMLVVAQDITERLSSEEALRESEERYRLLFERNLAGVFRMTLYGRVLHCNQAMAQMLGYTLPQEVLAHRLQDFYFSAEDLSRFVNELVSVGWVTNFEMRMRRQDGTPLWVIANVSTKMEAPGDLRVMEGTLVDITARKLAEERLREFEKAVEGLEEMLAVVDREYRYVLANRAFLNYLGRKREQIAGLAVRDLMGAELFDNVIKKRLDECFEGKVLRYELEFNYPKVGIRDLFASLIPIEGPNGVERVAVIVDDITERKRAEEALRRSEAYLAAGERLTHTGSWAWNVASGELFWSQETYRIFGFDPAQVKASVRDTFLPRIHPDDRARVEEGLRNPEEEGDAAYRIVLPDGSTRQIHEIMYSVKDPNGTVVERFGIASDITERKKAEEALRKSEQRFRRLAESNMHGVTIGDSAGRFVYANDAYLSMVGYTREDLQAGRLRWDVITPPDQRHVPEMIRMQLSASGIIAPLETVHLHKDGRRVPVLIGLASMEGSEQQAIGFVIDLTERKRAEEKLKDSEAGLAAAQRIAHIGSWHWNIQTNTATWSDETFRIFGIAPRELGDHRISFLDMVHPEDRARVDRALSDALEGTHEYDIDYRILHPNGLERVIHAQGEVLKDEDGTPLSMRGTLHDITEAKWAEEALRESEDKYRSIVLNIPEVVWTIDSHGRPVFVTPNIEKLIGYTEEETREGGLAFIYERLHPEDVERMMQTVQASFQDGRPRELEYRCRRKDGRWIWVHSRCTNVFEKDGVGYLQGLLSDVTEQKLAEAALRDSETRYRTIFESAGDAILLSKDDVIVDCSARALDLFHCTRVQLIGHGVFAFSPVFQPDGSESKPSAMETLEQVMAKKTLNLQWQFQRRDKTFFDAEIRLTRLDVAGESYLLGVVRDVTEYRRAEKNLVRLRHAVNASGEVVFMTDQKGIFTLVNPEFTRLYGYTEPEVLGKVTPRILKSGSIDAAHYARFWDALLNKRVARGEITNKTKDGQMVVVASSVNPVLDEKGEIAGYLAIQRDVTERKRLEQQYFQAQKMEAVGRLAAGVAHDFNNLLTIINGYSDLLLERLPTDDRARDPVGEIKGAGERATGLARQLLAFSRQEIRTSRVLDMNALVADSLKMLRRLIGEDVDLVFIPGTELGMIKADPGQIEQVLLNLAVNARDAMPTGGKLTIETSNFLADQAYVSTHYPMSHGSYVMLAVSDTGEGMDAETRARIFEPFFTTKGQGKGTGLGLATVYGIVKQSGGYAWVYSELGQGTAFKIYLPMAEGTPDAMVTAGAVAGGSETVLLVEDEAKLRALARSILESRGYKVLEAPTSMEALLIPGQHEGPVHLLLTDVVMPVMSGRELAEKLTKLHPQMKILFMSGYTDDTVVRHGVLESGMSFLQKPFSPEALARKVREVLDSREVSS